MEHLVTTSTHKKSLLKEHQPLQSEPISEKAANQSRSHCRHHLTLPLCRDNRHTHGQAEQYVLLRSQMSNSPNEEKDTSPQTPASSSGASISSIQSFMSHAERMHQWNQCQANETSKKHKHQYVYGPPPSRSGKTLFSPMSFTPSNAALWMIKK